MAQEPLPEVDPKRVPKYEFIDGHFYCDGIRCHPRQLTRAEIMKYIPANFQKVFLDQIDKGPEVNPQKVGG